MLTLLVIIDTIDPQLKTDYLHFVFFLDFPLSILANLSEGRTSREPLCTSRVTDCVNNSVARLCVAMPYRYRIISNYTVRNIDYKLRNSHSGWWSGRLVLVWCSNRATKGSGVYPYFCTLHSELGEHSDVSLCCKFLSLLFVYLVAYIDSCRK